MSADNRYISKYIGKDGADYAPKAMTENQKVKLAYRLAFQHHRALRTGHLSLEGWYSLGRSFYRLGYSEAWDMAQYSYLLRRLNNV